MPRIQDEYLETAIFFIKASRMPRRAVKPVEAAFSLVTNSIQEPKHIYAVTNAHVVIDGFTTIRLNAEHETATVETKTSDWIMDPDGDDLAITLLPVQPNHEYKYFYSDVLLDETGAKEHGIGPGDDVFMIGRLIAHSGTKRNLPVARFGNIAMLPLREPQELPSKEPTARSGRDAFDKRF